MKNFTGDQMIIIDTNIFYAFYNVNDVDHDRAKGIYTRVLDGEYGKPVLLDYVFDELTTLIQVRNNNKLASQIGAVLMKDTEDVLEFMQVSFPTFHSAWNIFQDQQERKCLSFTDSVIIATAQILNLKHIATFEGGFHSFKGIEIINS